ncbi:hypothetical protein D3C85_566390 [compost metagenome]
MAIIYRIVDHNRRGVYCAAGNTPSLWSKVYDNSWSNDKQPSPCNDGMPDVKDEHRFGFKTPEQLKRWTESKYCRELLTRHGGMVNIYSVPDKHIVEGRHQVAFIRRNAKLIGRVPVTHFD